MTYLESNVIEDIVGILDHVPDHARWDRHEEMISALHNFTQQTEFSDLSPIDALLSFGLLDMHAALTDIIKCWNNDTATPGLLLICEAVHQDLGIKPIDQLPQLILACA